MTMTSGHRTAIFAAITAERARQEALWGGVHDHGNGSCASPDLSPMVKVAVLTEECGEVARAVLAGDWSNLARRTDPGRRCSRRVAGESAMTCIGIEREQQYLDLAVRRLSKPIQPDMFGAVS